MNDIRRYLDIINEADESSYLKSIVDADQAERRAYQSFVHSQAGGDWQKGAALYAKAKGRAASDIFGERGRQREFMQKAKAFNFAEFRPDDWHNFWLVAQHCDGNRAFQKAALRQIEQYLGTASEEYRYLSDRISCATTGQQTYGTQDICERD